MPAEGGDAFTKELVPFDLLGKLARSKGSSTPDVWLKTLADSAATAWKKRKQACDELTELANGQAMVRVLCHVALCDGALLAARRADASACLRYAVS